MSTTNRHSSHCRIVCDGRSRRSETGDASHSDSRMRVLSYRGLLKLLAIPGAFLVVLLSVAYTVYSVPPDGANFCSFMRFSVLACSDYCFSSLNFLYPVRFRQYPI